jgi:uroporphyrinogen III methyltransferase/synthase
MVEEAEMAGKGIVFVVGAGPGNMPGLLTVRGKELLSGADAVVYERRAQRSLIPGGASGGPKRIYTGARDKVTRAAAADVGLLLVSLARRDMRVVYLASGDPFALGRGTEIVTALHDAAVEFEIVPGVSSSNAAATYAGIPLLSPSLASTTIFASGHDSTRGGAETDWTAIAKVGATVVVRNATAALPAIVTGFALAGVPGEIPAAAIVHAGRPTQRTIVATLGTISDEIVAAGMIGSVSLVIGWTVLLRDELAWFDTRPLFGVRILFARSRHGPRAVAERLAELGASVVDVPLPVVARLDRTGLQEEIERVAQYEWIVFSSPEAVTIFWEQLVLAGRDTRSLSNAKIACVGPATAAALLDHGVTVDVVQEKFDATALLDLLAERPDVPGAALLYVAEDATAEPFGRDLEQAGAMVTSLPLYRGVPAAKPLERLRSAAEARHPHLAVVMSPSAAEDYLHAASEHPIRSVPAAAYDAATGDVLRAGGIEVAIEPARPGVEALIEEIRTKFGRSGSESDS